MPVPLNVGSRAGDREGQGGVEDGDGKPDEGLLSPPVGPDSAMMELLPGRPMCRLS